MNIISNIYKPDIIGSLASTLCLIHCMITPIVFITQACTLSCCANTPLWWQSIDYIFIIISFFAIYKANQTSNNQAIKKLLWLLWFAFATLTLNKTLGILYVNKNICYFAGISLAVLHLYNLRYCQCTKDGCCVV